MLAYLLPIAVLLVATLLIVDRAGKGGLAGDAASLPRPCVLLAASGVIAAPALLALAGWDAGRWAFMLVSNFFLVLWLLLRDARSGELYLSQLSMLVAAGLLVTHVPFPYHNQFEPRPLQWSSFVPFTESVVDDAHHRKELPITRPRHPGAGRPRRPRGAMVATSTGLVEVS